jgi:retron-type reverse transcriptase
MGLVELIKRLFGGGEGRRSRARPPRGTRPTRAARGTGLGLMDLSRRLRLPVTDLQLTPVRYDQFTIPKRSGGTRTILAPQPKLKALQRRVLRRLLGRLKAHPAAMGFERGRSIVINARPHLGAAVVLRMDLRGFFPSTATHRVREYFTAIGWGSEAVYLLVKWCTCDGGLPQGAPTSPRLSNLVNYQMDCRLHRLAGAVGAAYTRYADDITFSFEADSHAAVAAAIRGTKEIVGEYGYRLHHKKKLSIRRRHQRQEVNGLVVNERIALPRETRRRLRAIRHHVQTGRAATLSREQLVGCNAFEQMIRKQATAP